MAVSGRALAASARRAGLVPLVADFFADADTRRIAHSCRKVAGDLKRGFEWTTLAPALAARAEAAPTPLLGVVYGAGFEDRTALLSQIAERWPLLGNGPIAVARVKAPEMFFAEIVRLGIPHPRTVMAPPAQAGGPPLELEELLSTGAEAIHDPAREPEEPELLRRVGLDRQAIRVLGVALGLADLLGVAFAPDAALA